MVTTVLPASTRRCKTEIKTGGVGDVQAGGGFVQQVERAPGGAPAQLFGQLHALGFTPRERGGRLAELQVSQTHVRQDAQAGSRGGYIGKQSQGFIDGHLQHLGDIVPPVMHRQGIRGEAPPMTGRAAHFDVREEVHLDRQHPGALTAFAAPAGHIEREVARRQSSLAGFGGGGKGLADGREGV